MIKEAIVILALLCVYPTKGRAEEGKGFDLSCVTSLDLPTHGFLAAASESGTVEVEIHLDGKTKAANVELRGGNPGLQGEVRAAIEMSKFGARCNGRVLKFVFAFTVQDPASDSILPPAVRFVPPNRFELTFRRVKPNHDPGSTPPHSK